MTLTEFRRFAIYLVIVAALFWACDRVAGLVLEKLLLQSKFRFSKLYNGGQAADVVVLGNSRSVNAFFAPEISKRLNSEVLHLGYNGMSMRIAELLLRDYIEQNATPELLLLEITNLHSSDDLLVDLRVFAGVSPRVSGLLGEHHQTLNSICRVSHLYRFNSEFFLRCLFYLGGNDQAWINSGTMSEGAAVAGAKRPFYTKSLFPTEGANWESLLRIILLCEEAGVELRLVVSPYFPPFLDGYKSFPQDLEAFMVAIPPFASVADYTRVVVDYTQFADPLHLNKSGSIEFLDRLFDDGFFDEFLGR